MSRHSKTLFLSLISLVAFCLFASCASDFNQNLQPARQQLNQARECGAQFCQPEAFASAEAYLDFAESSYESGNRMEAEVYLDRANEQLTVALTACDECRADLDGDGIVDTEDQDPYRAEDMDGFQDEDGIPDYDNDGDGILDTEDQCPQEPEDFDGFEDSDGCPDPDNDNDGIPDAFDQCPNEPEDIDGYQDEDGCPDQDNDGDGIPDVDDACPNHPETFNGFLDDDGCPDQLPTRRKFILLPEVQFLGDTLFLTENSMGNLAAFAQRLKKHRKLHVRIEGHTYSRGEADDELELTKKRAAKIRDILISFDIEPERLTALGFGAQRPLADSETRAGRQKNDRIDFIIYLP